MSRRQSTKAPLYVRRLLRCLVGPDLRFSVPVSVVLSCVLCADDYPPCVERYPEVSGEVWGCVERVYAAGAVAVYSGKRCAFLRLAQSCCS